MEKPTKICHVLGCKKRHKSLHLIPSDGRRDKWLNFIFQGNVPGSIHRNTLVCACHFTRESFVNIGQYEQGLAKLILKKDAIPTLRGDGDIETASTTASSAPLCSSKDVDCQTDMKMYDLPTRPQTRSAGTQTLPPSSISIQGQSRGTQCGQRTVQVKIRRIQVNPDCRDSAVMTSPQNLSAVFRSTPCKRRRVDSVDEDVSESEGPLFQTPEDPNDTYIPGESVTVQSESVLRNMDADLFMKCDDYELEPCQRFDDGVEEDDMDIKEGIINDNPPVTVSVGPNTITPIVASAPTPTGASLVPTGTARQQKLILKKAPAELGTTLKSTVTPGTHPAVNQPIGLTMQQFPVQNVRPEQSTVNPVGYVLNVQQSQALQPITLLTINPIGGIALLHQPH